MTERIHRRFFWIIMIVGGLGILAAQSATRETAAPAPALQSVPCPAEICEFGPAIIKPV